MKLLFIFTGGTIGSTQKDNVISPDLNKSYKIINAYKEKYGIDFDYDVVEPYTELSENNTGFHLKTLAECVQNNLDKNYSGMVITHGTDTLQYSASIIGYTVGLDSLPICLVSSNAPIENPVSNALDNLHGAINFIKQKAGNGVFVIYRNGASDTVLAHRATRLLESKAYSDEVISVLNQPYGMFDTNFTFVKNNKYNEKKDDTNPLSCKNITSTNEHTQIIQMYPGISYPEISSNVKYIIINTYHSGTLDTKSETARKFFLKAKENGITVFATGIYDGPQYSSAKHYAELGITPIMNLSPVVAYVKLWLADSMGLAPKKMLSLSLSGDII